jgi:Tfp pilus assembly protein PilO
MTRSRLPAFVAKADLVDVVGAAVAAALTVAFVFGALLPIAVRDRMAAAQADAAVRTQQRANALAASIRAITAEIDGTRTRLASAPLQIRPASALNERLAALVALAAECGLGVQDLKPGDGVRGPKFLMIPVRVSGTGGYPDVTRFLHRLHDRMPDIAVEGFKLAEAPGGNTAGGRYALDLRWVASLSDVPHAPAQAVAATP